jgi:hypothetical protein
MKALVDLGIGPWGPTNGRFLTAAPTASLIPTSSTSPSPRTAPSFGSLWSRW